ncbi:type II toxin-antitoxin system PemK/MazF family toxin [Vibrio sp. TMPB1044]|uniref:type II toxin-antitoxin system PemK/MazF family toxin n=1 Tax=Vibrio sp. TMPB1044 TaxID=3051822 RepID=UPI00255BE426|nr:type II toxin-antitoxin system PemK/MazF family toxin [Vibrio sp. TMPB1044]MDL5025630.1 type II toxin-antitoxin system PemK/MazF family toxin [Vibrio sp. TMPB1044]MDN5205758.1 type II toxin-antitoxin system PemK/MazF family toxin [Vibrio sp. TMPB1044]
MTIRYSPKIGQILMCDFSGFKAPELIKNRPVLVINTRPNGHRLVSIVGLSTTPPKPPQPYHLKLDDNNLPRHRFFQGAPTWVKGDMLYTVSFDRLSYISLGSEKGKRIYFQNRLGRETMRNVYSCTLHGLNLGFLAEHL